MIILIIVIVVFILSVSSIPKAWRECKKNFKETKEIIKGTKNNEQKNK